MLCKHDQGLFNDVKNVKRHLQETKANIIDEGLTRKVEENMCKNVEEALHTEEMSILSII